MNGGPNEKMSSNVPLISTLSWAQLQKLQSDFIEISLRHGFSPVKLLHIFRTPFYKNTSEGLLLLHLALNYQCNASSKIVSYIKRYLLGIFDIWSTNVNINPLMHGDDKKITYT